MEILALEDNFVERLAGDEYDLAIRDRWSLRSARHLRTLFDEDYVCIARRDHPRLSREPTLDDFLDEGHVLISPRGRVPGVVDGPLKRLGRQRRVAVTLPHFLAGPAIVARTDFVMTIPRRIGLKFSELYALRIFAPPLRVPGFDVAVAWSPRYNIDPAVPWLRDRIQALQLDGPPALALPDSALVRRLQPRAHAGLVAAIGIADPPFQVRLLARHDSVAGRYRERQREDQDPRA